MKGLIPFLILLPVFSWSQIDTIPNGMLEVVDSVNSIRIEYNFKDSKLDGSVKGFDLDSNWILYEYTCVANQKQGKWNYFSVDSTGTITDTTGYYTYLNDTLNGPFQIEFDSIRVTGNYKNNLLEGAYKREYSVEVDSDLIWIPIDSGQFKDSIPYGQWTYLVEGRLHKTGFFENGKKHNIWLEYDLYNKSEKDVLMRETRYFEGVKTGNEKIFFHYIYEDSDDGIEDTIKVNEFEQIPWQDGKLSGQYIRKAGDGTVLEKGTYNEDKRVSTWVYYDPETLTKETRTLLDNKLNGPYIKQIDEHIVLEGTYAMDQKHKTWKYFDDNGKPQREEVYDHDMKTGEWKYFNYKGYVGLSKIFEKDTLIKLIEYNQVEVDVLNLEFQYTENGVELVVEELFEDSLETKTFLLSNFEVEHNSFMESYKQKKNDSSIFVLNGGYTVKKGGSIEVSGFYENNIMHDWWDYFFNSSIIWKIKYDHGNIAGEQFVEKINGNPLAKGEYVLWYGPERPRLEFKIKEGVRHGKSTWYDREGEVIKEEKYKEGVLQ